MKIQEKKELLQLIETVRNLQEKIKNNISSEDEKNVLINCQEAAIAIGTEIEKKYSDNIQIVHELEQYCELIYEISQIKENVNKNIVYIKLEEKLRLILQMVERIKTKYRVAFFPYKADMWDSLESIWEEFSKDERFESAVVVIPYFSANRQNGEWEYHYDADRFPKNVPIVSFKEYSLNEMKPDLAFIHNPFDKYNLVTSVHPDYYSSELKQYIKKLVYANMLCNDTKISNDGTLTGDPTETALVDMAFKLDFDPSIYDRMPRIEEVPFDSDRKLMTTVNEVNGKYIVYTKGGVDELLKRCKTYLENGEIKQDLDNYSEVISKNNEKMAKEALRVLACAYKEIDHKPTKTELENIEEDLTFIGMVGMIDPPREEAKKAVEKCKTAGIKTVMITGDHKITATAIAKKLGILEDEDEALTGLELEKMSDEDLQKNVRHYSVYARVSPEHKVRIVKAWQKNGEIVAMTGDGVNDSPALKTADIGCAMGVVGTDVAKEAAEVILTDDNFATIVSAVEEGRRIYDNILKVIQFLLSSNVGEIIVLLLATLCTPLFAKWFGITDISNLEILLPIHILWINLVTDSLPALALAFDPANSDIMKRKPAKPNQGVFTKGMTWRVIYQGAMIGILTLVAFMVGLSTTTPIEGLSLDETKIEVGQTMAFVTLAMSELVHVFNIRDNKKSIFKAKVFNNSKLIWAIIASAALMLVILAIPVLREIFSIPVLPTQNIVELILLILAPLAIVEIFKLLKINTIKDE